MEQMTVVLKIFHTITQSISGEKYATVIPFIERIKKHLGSTLTNELSSITTMKKLMLENINKRYIEGDVYKTLLISAFEHILVKYPPIFT